LEEEADRQSTFYDTLVTYKIFTIAGIETPYQSSNSEENYSSI
jgi:hypothetical protein